jgi:hypothetical protein
MSATGRGAALGRAAQERKQLTEHHVAIGMGLPSLQVGRDLSTVLLGQKRLDLARGHAAGIHGDDLVVETGEALLVFGNQDWIEAAVTVVWNIGPQRAVLGQHGLGALAVAVVGRPAGRSAPGG